MKNELLIIVTTVMAYMFAMSTMDYHSGDPAAVGCFYISLTYLTLFAIANRHWHYEGRKKRR